MHYLTTKTYPLYIFTHMILSYWYKWTLLLCIVKFNFVFKNMALGSWTYVIDWEQFSIESKEYKKKGFYVIRNLFK